MHHPKLIIITGAPGAGKTTLLKEIVSKYPIPYFYKDEFKELYFDSVTNLNLELSKELGVASFKTLFMLIERFAKYKLDLIIEANFRPKFCEEELQIILKKYNVSLLQILCECPYEVLKNRLVERKLSGNRHKGHFDLGRDEEFEKQIKGGDYRFFDIEGSVKISIDTAKKDKELSDGILKSVDNFLAD